MRDLPFLRNIDPVIPATVSGTASIKTPIINASFTLYKLIANTINPKGYATSPYVFR